MRSPARGNLTMFLFMLYLVVLQMVLGVVIVLFDLELDVLAMTAVVQVVGIFVPFLFYILLTKQRFKDVLSWRPLSIGNALTVIIMTIAIIPMVNLVSELTSYIFHPIIGDSVVEMTTGASLWVNVLVIGVFPSLFEEFMFRGAIYKEYEGVPIKKAAIVTGLFFGIMHMNFHQAIYAALFGVLYAYILYYTRSILAPMLMHFVNNSVATVMFYYSDYTTVDAATASPLVIFGGLSLLTLPILILCLNKLRRYYERTSSEFDSPQKLVTNTYEWQQDPLQPALHGQGMNQYGQAQPPWGQEPATQGMNAAPFWPAQEEQKADSFWPAQQEQETAPFWPATQVQEAAHHGSAQQAWGTELPQGPAPQGSNPYDPMPPAWGTDLYRHTGPQRYGMQPATPANMKILGVCFWLVIVIFILFAGSLELIMRLPLEEFIEYTYELTSVF